jgi:hypothetical protein
MSDVLDRVPVDRITVEARQVRFGVTLLRIVAGVLYGIGWLTAKAFGAVWLAVAWACVAVKLGWTDARGGRNRGSA